MLRASCLLTYRESGSAERRENLLAVMRWLSGHRDVEIVVVEQDAAPTLDASLVPASGRIAFARNPGLFNKGWGLNVAARQSTAPVLAICDADVIAPGFEAALERCLADTEAVKPYKSIIDLTEEESKRVRAGDWDFAPQRPPNAPPDRQAIGEIVNFGGGLFLIRRELFGRLGGFDERFRGWGGEDDAMALKIARSGARRAEFGERPALHLFHPRPHEATFGQPNYEANRALLAECAAYSPAEYRRVCEVGRQIAGNPEKYRAAP